MKITKTLLEKLILEVIKDFDEEDLPLMQTAEDPDPSMGRPLPKSMIRRGDVQRDPDKYPAQRDRMISRFEDGQKLFQWQEYYLPKIERQYKMVMRKGADALVNQFYDIYGGKFVDTVTNKLINNKKAEGEIPNSIKVDGDLREKIFVSSFFAIYTMAKQNNFFDSGDSNKADLLKDVYQIMIESGLDDASEFGLNKTKTSAQHSINPLAGTTTG